MPRQQQPINLWLRPARYDSAGKLTHRAVWIIREGSRQVRSTGCGAEDRQGAERELEDYLADRRGEKVVDLRRGQSAEELWVADVLTRYIKAKGSKVARPKGLGQRVVALLEYWGDKTLAQVNSITCAEYVSRSVGRPWKSAKPEKTGNAPRLLTEAALRRQLEDLRAAINLAIVDGICRDIVRVVLPDENPQREEWLTPEEVDKLIEICRKTQEVQIVHRGPRKDEKVVTKRRPLAHVENFIRVGVLTGTRASAVCQASFEQEVGRPFIDLKAGLFYRRPPGTRDKKQKRYTPVPLASELVTEMQAWREKGAKYVVEFDGRPVDCRKAFETVVRLARLGKPVVRHTLRHTAATWMMQSGVEPWMAAGFLGMTVETLLRRYGHHHPSYLKTASAALAARLPRKRNQL